MVKESLIGTQNQADNSKCIWTIGHSTRSKEDFLSMLKSFNIEVLVDVRRFPGSKKYPQFNVSELEKFLPESGIKYTPLVSLGGRRKPDSNSVNTIWRNEAFRRYADYTQSEEFLTAINILTDAALISRTAYMCSEAVWWRCHRAIISDYLKERGWIVMHIMKENFANEHPYTTAFRAMHSL